jgi:DNA-binding transcriptional MerR regulator
MPARLPNAIKSLVIQQWLQGRPRNDIAAENGLSSGAVTNIVNEWRLGLGFAAADELRELALALKRVGISAAQCALGFRIASIILKIGIKEDSFESFILDVYNRCRDIGLSPENISSYLQDLVEFSRDVLPISEIPYYINEKIDEKRKLEEGIEKLNVQISTLKQEKKNCESLRDQALEEKEMTISELKWYSNLRAGFL